MADIYTLPHEFASMVNSWRPDYTVEITADGSGAIVSFTVTIDHENKTITVELSTS